MRLCYTAVVYLIAILQGNALRTVVRASQKTVLYSTISKKQADTGKLSFSGIFDIAFSINNYFIREDSNYSL
jgi:hypothetical protein